nr:MAG TPA: hypothetical protein [Caudoviricetes sp.]
MAKIEIINRYNKEEFLKCCFVFATKTRNNPMVMATALEQGIHHFELNRANGMVEIKAALNANVEEIKINFSKEF